MKTSRKRMRVTDLNPNLICVLCGGYFIDATTLTECLHSFCKTCIVNFLKTSKHCPVCDVMVHKTKPHLHIRSDKTLQDLVYKLVPGLYKNEMKRRRDYYTEHPLETPPKVGEERGDENAERILYTEDEKFSLALHFCSQGVKDERSVRTLTLPEVGASAAEMPKNVRFLQCPAGVTVDILKKFVRIKYELPEKYQIDIFHTDESLRDDFTLMDVAYIYTWRRKEPLKLYFSVYEFIVKRRKVDCTVSKRLLDLNNLNHKHEAKNSADTKAETKPDTTLAQSNTKSATGDKLGKQGSKEGVKEEEKKEEAGDIKGLELMDTSSAGDQRNKFPGCEPKAGETKSSDAKETLHVKLARSGEDETAVKRENTAAEKAEMEKDVKVTAKPVTSSATTVHLANNAVHNTPSKPSSSNPKAVLFKNAAAGGAIEKDKGLNHTGAVSKATPASLKPVTVNSACVSSSVNTVPVTSHLSNGVHNASSVGSAQMLLGVSQAVSAKSQTQILPKGDVARPEVAKTTAGNTRKKAVVQQPSAAPTSTSAASSAAGGPAARPSSLPAPATGQTKAGVARAKPKTKSVLPAPASATNSLPSAAAGAAGAASPTPAALAASSSPSPPMASSAACVKDTVDQPLKLSVSSPHPAPTLTPTLPTSLPPFKQLPSASVALTVPVVSTAMRSFNADSASKSVLKTPSTTKTSSVSAGEKAAKSTPAQNDKRAKASSVLSGGGKTVKDSSTMGVAPGSVNKLLASAATSLGQGADSLKQGKEVSVPVVSGKTSSATSPRVLTAGRVAVLGGQAAGPLSGRNGMPAVVTKPTRVSNAATSVNTLLHKLPVSSPQRSAVKTSEASTTTAATATATATSLPARPSGTASPVCKQQPPTKTLTSPEAGSKPSPALPAKAASSHSPKADSSKAGVAGSGAPKQTVRRTGIATTVSVQPSRPGGTPAQTSRPNATPAPVTVPSSRPSGASTPVPSQPGRASGAATPVPIQPQPLVSSGQALALAGCSPIAVAAMRRASEMQTFQQVFAQHAKQQQQHQQQQQQQLLEFQQLQLLQQQQIFNYHAAAIALARYSQLQQSSGLTSPTHLPAAVNISPAVSAATASQPPPQLQPATDTGKKQTTPEAPAKKQTQASTAGKKGGEPSPKKKITDIANSLHKKVSQQSMVTGASSTAKADVSTASSDKRPPHAHTPTAPKADAASSGCGAKGGAAGKGEDEPLNLVMARSAACNGAAVTVASTTAALKPVAAEKSA